jgi:hypothetical protein
MYEYEKQKPELFTDAGQRMFLRVRDFVGETLEVAGAVRMDKCMDAAGVGGSWTMLACVDRMVELGELREITPEGFPCQYRVFIPCQPRERRNERG